MYNKLIERRRELEGKQGGFTLIELLVVVVIIGILVAIAIPLYLHFENGAHTSGAASDVHGMTNLVKLCQSDNGGTLPAAATQTTAGGTFSFTGTTACDADTYNLSNGDTATYAVGTYASGAFTAGTGTDFEVTVTNGSSGKTWTYESGSGQTVES